MILRTILKKKERRKGGRRGRGGRKTGEKELLQPEGIHNLTLGNTGKI